MPFVPGFLPSKNAPSLANDGSAGPVCALNHWYYRNELSTPNAVLSKRIAIALLSESGAQ